MTLLLPEPFLLQDGSANVLMKVWTATFCTARLLRTNGLRPTAKFGMRCAKNEMLGAST